jgi:hypothetical protein
MILLVRTHDVVSGHQEFKAEALYRLCVSAQRAEVWRNLGLGKDSSDVHGRQRSSTQASG